LALIIVSNIEILVLRAKAEITGYAVHECRGIMEYWNVGMMG